MLFQLTVFCLIVFRGFVIQAYTDPYDIHGLQEFANTVRGSFLQSWDFTHNPLDPCNDHWTGITCISNTTTGKSNVIKLDLPGQEISGFLSPQITLFHLSHLNLSQNNLQGSVPDLAILPSLLFLDLSANQLTGAVPNFESAVSYVVVMTLSANHLTGTVPSCVNAPLMSVIDLHQNDLTGIIPDFSQNNQLVFVDLSFNKLQGKIPNFLTNPGIQFLNFGGNQLTGHVPDFNAMNQLLFLDLHQNHLSGSIPDFHSVPYLSYLGLHFNQFTGSVPDFHSIPRLYYLDLQFNQLAGTIPDFRSLPGLYYLDLHSNKLSGTVPDFHFIPGVYYLDLHFNELTGTLPDFHNLPAVYWLDVYGNQLHGTIPDFQSLGSVFALVLNNNYFTGTIPQLQSMKSMFGIHLDANQLTGTVPSFPGMYNLSWISFGTNYLTGTIPSFVLPRMIWLTLEMNHLTGTLPNFDFSSFFQYLRLSGNQLTGTIPLFDHLHELVGMDLGKNEFAGKVNLKPKAHLRFLSLTSNQFTGPLKLAHIPSLQTIDVKSNSFTGVLTDIISPENKELFALELSDNNFGGKGIPDQWFLQFPKLKVLSISKNCFSGTVSAGICQSPHLAVLAMDGLSSSIRCQDRFFDESTTSNTAYQISNGIYGTVPGCLFQLPELEILHLSGNGLTGHLPDLRENSMLYDLVLSHNRLEGSIPESILFHSWKNLDLSVNKLSGKLDQKMNAASNESSKLSLSINRLSGLVQPDFEGFSSVDILEGNLFDCVTDVSGNRALPENDPQVDSYSCGSNSANDSVYVFLVVLGNLCLFFLWSSCAVLIPTIKRLPEQIERFCSWRMTGVNAIAQTNDNTYLNLEYQMKFILFFLIIIFIPVYSGLVSFKTHDYTYIWIVSIGYLSGLTPGITLLVFIVFFYFAFAYLIEYQWKHYNEYSKAAFDVNASAKEESQKSKKNNIKDDNKQQSWKKRTLKFLIGFIACAVNFMVVGIVNIGYIYLLNLSITVQEKAILQFSVAILKFMMGLGGTLLKKALVALFAYVDDSKSTSFYDLSEQTLSGEIVQTLSFVSITNTVVIPLIATVMFEPNCFKNIFFQPNEIVTSFTWSLSQVFFQFQFDFIFLTETKFIPPFFYNHQCTSSLLNDFVAVFIYEYALGIGVLLFKITILPVVFPLIVAEKWQRKVIQLFSNLFSFYAENKETEGTNGNIDEENRFIEGEMWLIQLVGDYSVLLTFGLAFPLLGVMICLSILFQKYCYEAILGRTFDRFSQVRRQENSRTPKTQIYRDVEQEDEKNDNEKEENFPQDKLSSTVYLHDFKNLYVDGFLYPTFKYIEFFSAIFVAFFLFDMTADELGFEQAIWIIPVISIFPILFYFIIRVLPDSSFTRVRNFIEDWLAPGVSFTTSSLQLQNLFRVNPKSRIVPVKAAEQSEDKEKS
jgi:Leucine-rich repeat (LRR) protein